MTDHLSTLLHDEASGLVVPPAPVNSVLARGRSMRRRRRAAVAGSVAAAVTVVAAGIAVLGPDGSDRTEPAKPSDQTAYRQLGAWAQGDELHVGNHTVTVDDLKELQYSTSGVVVVTARDDYVLVTPDGVVHSLDLDLVDSPGSLNNVATDPTTPNLAYVRALGGGQAQAVVRDLATGEETTVGRPFQTQEADGAGWVSGDLMLYFRDGDGRLVNWRTGRPAVFPGPGWWYGSGVVIDYDQDGTWTLTSFDGESLLTAPSDPAGGYGTLSPGGRYFAVSDIDAGIVVHELATGTSAVVEGRAAPNYGWTPDGHLVGKLANSSGEVEVCDPGTGECEGTGIEAAGRLTLVTAIPGTAP
jgi:hypothetical protein